MRKTDKKIDNQLRLALNQICEMALKQEAGFAWLTHKVNYAQFPNSLKVICVFETNALLDSFLQSKYQQQLTSEIHTQLAQLNIKLKKIDKHLVYDSEENCEQQHNGNWANRVLQIK